MSKLAIGIGALLVFPCGTFIGEASLNTGFVLVAIGSISMGAGIVSEWIHDPKLFWGH